ncbi:glycosyltransferase family 10 domain-containing protein [Methylotenera sp. L2L1]|uniref:glycosyltransferase family 10 domain-containing protein n=1 Tax=Methylotenera sp. L2L1 TaxID=1502770 RepID=UPI00055C6459|nr:glycosyltransferase family 10 [Methylotenera sp. L2L1]
MSDVIYANFEARGFAGNVIFDLSHKNNRDNCFQPYYLMREQLKQHGIEINTSDTNVGKSLAFELHMDVQKQSVNTAYYLLMLETPQVWPSNGIASNWDCYRKVFTWNDDLVDGNRFIKINFPNPVYVGPVIGFSDRDQFCCLISSNRTLSLQDNRDLYPERVNAIRWFETHAQQDFDLYGVGWDIPVVRSGLVGKIERRFWGIIGRLFTLQPFPSYRGKVAHKQDVLTRTKFSICYENMRDLPGYITEKIFDSFFSGCVPVYWGASNITDYIPADCFVDRRQFNDTEDVYRFLKSMTEIEFVGYQQRIAAFLQSEAVYQFGSEFFAKTIVNTIIQDIGLEP